VLPVLKAATKRSTTLARIAELHALLALTSDWSRDGQGDADCNQRYEAGSQH